ncbi:MAG: helix-turn-helix domain-containing protein [Chloroflexi bacterium]|nr:helix-turn-helix domain-containing protein [Chloroflexota bacterium]
MVRTFLSIPRENIKSAERTLSVWEFFVRIQRAASLQELSANLGYPRSGTAALIASLVKLGYLIHDRAARKHLSTARIVELGSWMRRSTVGEDRDRIVPKLHALPRKIERFGTLEKGSYPEVPLRLEYRQTRFGERFSATMERVQRLQRELDGAP